MSQKNTIKYHHFYLLFPNVFGFKGGIQVYSCFLLKALQDLCPKDNYDIFLKYDKSNSSQWQKFQFLSHTNFHYFGHIPKLIQSIILAIKVIILGIIQRPNLVITTHVNYAIICYFLKIFTGTPYWVIAHGTEVWDLRDHAHQLALRNADKIISVSNYTSQRLLQDKNINPGKIALLPNTFDSSKFTINSKPGYLLKRYGLSLNQPVILTVTRMGRMAKYKGYDQVLYALVKVRHYIPNVHYILAGKGDDQPRIQALIASLNLQDCVTLAGFVPDKELCDHYNLCDVFTMPSIGEGFGIVYLEALACGKPVLAGNQDGSVDPLVGGKLGCLVDPHDIEEISNSLIDILQGNYFNHLIYQPEYLRQKTIESFDFVKFRATLAELLKCLAV
ncbi:MAG TPA: glycosyltransferase [Nostocaceae cyanobacterium]|nr:glycosyltransferase [Nostocaceae cyanobacterium]